MATKKLVPGDYVLLRDNKTIGKIKSNVMYDDLSKLPYVMVAYYDYNRRIVAHKWFFAGDRKMDLKKLNLSTVKNIYKKEINKLESL